jgi:acetyl esterase/lipase
MGGTLRRSAVSLITRSLCQLETERPPHLASGAWYPRPVRKPIYAGLALVGTACLLAAQQPASAPVAPSPSPSLSTSGASASTAQVPVDENVQYGEAHGQKLLLDVFEPAGNSPGPHPAVVLIHGGGWTSFDKSTMRGMGQVLARAGFVAFSVDYRLFQNSENQWRAQLDDVQRAVRWVRASALKYSVDRERIGAFGHSAGAQLAALLGMEDTRDNSDPVLAAYSSRVQAVLDVSGPADFTQQHDAEGDAFLSSFLGAEYSKRPEVWRDASPLSHVSKTNAPFLIVHGTRDSNVPIAESETLAERLRQAGVPVTLVKVDDGHTFQTPEARRRLAYETLEFFNRYLKTGK